METNKIVERHYTYKSKTGKPYTVKRRYFVKHDRQIKNDELDEYFKYHLDELQSKKKLKDIVDEYNSNHLKISYAKFYLKYKEIFGYRKNHKEIQEEEDFEENEDEETKNENKN